MNTDTIQDIIRDAHALAQWTGEADLIRSGAETIARRLERLVERGLYITPKAALDVVAGERPLDKMLKTPMSEGVKECGSEGVDSPTPPLPHSPTLGLLTDCRMLRLPISLDDAMRMTASELTEATNRAWDQDGKFDPKTAHARAFGEYVRAREEIRRRAKHG